MFLIIRLTGSLRIGEESVRHPHHSRPTGGLSSGMRAYHMLLIIRSIGSLRIGEESVRHPHHSRPTGGPSSGVGASHMLLIIRSTGDLRFGEGYHSNTLITTGPQGALAQG